jgi:hypothetical protein
MVQSEERAESDFMVVELLARGLPQAAGQRAAMFEMPIAQGLDPMEVGSTFPPCHHFTPAVRLVHGCRDLVAPDSGPGTAFIFHHSRPPVACRGPAPDPRKVSLAIHGFVD